MNKRTVGRPRDGNPDETRRGILKAAEEGFAASGYVGATTRQVATKAGVNVATLHYHFGNKEGLYRAVLEEAGRGELPGAPATGTPSERLARLVEGLYDHGTARPSLARLSLLDMLAGPPPAPDSPPDEGDPRVVAVRRLLASIAGPNGNGRSLSPDAASRCIVTLLDASLVSRKPVSLNVDQPAVPDTVARASVVAAALKVAGLS